MKNDEKIHPLYRNLFTGPTDEQMKRINASRKLQEDYLDWVYENRGATEKECKDKYEALKKASGL